MPLFRGGVGFPFGFPSIPLKRVQGTLMVLAIFLHSGVAHCVRSGVSSSSLLEVALGASLEMCHEKNRTSCLPSTQSIKSHSGSYGSRYMGVVVRGYPVESC